MKVDPNKTSRDEKKYAMSEMKSQISEFVS